MAIKGGSIIHVGNGDTLIDRVQTGGPGQVNIPTEKIYELGNYKSVATVRDTPDLTFSLESYDVSTEIEALVSGMAMGRTVADASIDAGSPQLTSAGGGFTAADTDKTVIVAGAGADGADLITTIDAVVNGTTVTLADNAGTTVADAIFRLVGEDGGYDLAKARPVDFATQFKAGQDAPDPFKVVSSVALPFLYVEQVSYRFGLRDNATQSVSMRGDTIFYNPGPTFVEEVAGSGADGQVIVTEHPAYQVAAGDQRRVLAVTAGKSRLNFGADYAETYGAVANDAAITTVTLENAVPADQIVRIVYSSPDVVQYQQSVHPSPVVKPAAIKGKDIEVYIGGYDPDDVAGSQVNKMTSIQAVNVDWRVTIDKDEEFGNYYAVGLDFDVPQVNGSVDIRPRDAAELHNLVAQVSGVADRKKVIGTSTSVALPMDVVLKNPENGQTLKRLHVPDARFTPPGYTGRVQQKTNVTLNFESDEGTLLVFDR